MDCFIVRVNVSRCLYALFLPQLSFGDISSNFKALRSVWSGNASFTLTKAAGILVFFLLRVWWSEHNRIKNMLFLTIDHSYCTVKPPSNLDRSCGFMRNRAHMLSAKRSTLASPPAWVKTSILPEIWLFMYVFISLSYLSLFYTHSSAGFQFRLFVTS